MDLKSKIKAAAATTAVALVCAGAAYAFIKRKNRPREAAEALNYIIIKTVSTEKMCDATVNELISRMKVHKALGFDCEWVTDHGKRKPVALVQLATFDGYCGLFRLCQLNAVPDSLKAILEDESIYKVGVAPGDDAKYLMQDYGVCLKSSLDVRHIAELCGYQPGGLAAMSRDLLGVVLDKNWRIRCSNWQADELSEKQLHYAAADAHVAVRIFVKLVKEYHGGWFKKMFTGEHNIWRDLDALCWQYVQVNYKTKKKIGMDLSAESENTNSDKSKSKEPVPTKRYTGPTRSKPLYDNCYLQAPDGEMLCTCDNGKAKWYVDKQLADVVLDCPLTVRLRFEPAGRSVGRAGQYYRIAKRNCCVVCGADNSYIRKNVVPKEYRKYFPEIMKDHVSHDVVLLCSGCHQLSNMRDQRVRERLAAQCGAPTCPRPDAAPRVEDRDLKKIWRAARALLYQTRLHTLPESRRKELEAVVLKYYPAGTELTHEMLEEAAHIDYIFENTSYESHGQKVVEHYLKLEGGLLRLEELWREHFLTAMRPRHLPELWSVTHSEERLRVRLKEGRLTEDEIKLMGLATKWL